MRFFDSHCHLESSKFENNIDPILKNMQSAGVSHCICAGSDIKSSKSIIDICNEHSNVFAAIGIHPHEAKHFKIQDLQTLKEWSGISRAIAIGEIGLDYYYEFSSREEQKYALNHQLDLALKLDLPIMFHVRDAHGDMLEILNKRNDVKKAVMHCYSGSLEIAKEYIEKGYVISFAGPITFKNAAKLPEIAKIVPNDKFFIETDSPYLAPVPYRGKINEPAYVVEVAKKIAEIKELSLSEIASLSFNNVCNFYNLNI